MWEGEKKGGVLIKEDEKFLILISFFLVFEVFVCGFIVFRKCSLEVKVVRKL